MKFILVYEQNGTFEAGGGIYTNAFDTIESMDERCNYLLTKGQNGYKCTVKFACEIKKQFEYAPVESVTKYERKSQA